MAAIIIPNRWTQQPQGPVDVIDESAYAVLGTNALRNQVLTPAPFGIYNGAGQNVDASNYGLVASGGLTQTDGTPYSVGCVFVPRTVSGTDIYVGQDQNGEPRNFHLRLNAGNPEFICFNTTPTAFTGSGTNTANVGQVSAILGRAGADSAVFFNGKKGGTSSSVTGTLRSRTGRYYIGRRNATQDSADGVVLLVVEFGRYLSDAEAIQWTLDPWRIFAPVQRRLYFDVAGGGGDTLLPSLVVDGDTFHAPTVAPGSVGLTPALFADGDTFHAATVTLGGAAQNLTPALFADADTFHAATVSPGAVSLTPALYADADAFHAPTVAPGTVALTPALFADGDTFHAPVVSIDGGPQYLSPDVFADGDTFHAVTVAPGAVSLTPSLYTDADTFHAAEVAAGYNLQPAAYADADAFHAATVTQGGPVLQPALFVDADTFYAATVTGGEAITVLATARSGARDLSTCRRTNLSTSRRTNLSTSRRR